MSHRAGEEFFERKKSWSIRKDRILGAYLAAYLPKVNRLGYPILLVDGFAGAGKFQDGTAGSPLIMRSAIRRASPTSGASVLAIEQDADLHPRLKSLFKDDRLVDVRHGTFLAHIEEIQRLADKHSVFMFLDPYAVRGLELAQMDSVCGLVQSGRSVEVLINFNAPIFVRWALAALKRPKPEDYIEDDGPATPELVELDRIVGGGWWREEVARHSTFAEQVRAIVRGYCDQLQERFQEVCFHEIYHRTRHTVPKYVLVFASRHPDALVLMNDRMVKSARQLIEDENQGQIDLFDLPLVGTTPDRAQIREHLRAIAIERMKRKDLIVRVVRRLFGQCLESDIRGEIEACLRSGEMASATGKVRINKDVPVWWVNEP